MDTQIDESGELLAAGSFSFKYDHFGRRIYKSSSLCASIFAYDGDNMIEEVNASGAVVARYAQGQNIDEPLAMSRSGATSYYEADGLGSVTSLTNGSGALAQTYTFDSFGKLTNSAGSLTNPFQYTAREFDSETGLYYYRARYYDPNTGRFLTEDPAAFASSENNFYRYAENDPADFADSLGLYTIQKHIMLVKEPNVQGLDDDCGTRTSGACTIAAAFLDCQCKGKPCNNSGWKASANVNIVGHMYVFGGPWMLLQRNPVDRSIVDMTTAIAHENNVHIDPAIDALKPLLQQLEAKRFGSESECEAACKAAKKAIADLFKKTMLKTLKKDVPQ